MSNKKEEKSGGFGDLLLKGAMIVGGAVLTGIGMKIGHEIIKEMLKEPADIPKVVKHYDLKPRMCFLILGGRRVGKTSLIEWFKSINVEDSKPLFLLPKNYQPTQPDGSDGAEIYVGFGDKEYNIAIPLDVAGEAGQFNPWKEIYQDASIDLNGLIFMIDHNDGISIDDHIQAWNNMFELFQENENRAFQRNIKALYIVVNKSDKWRDEITAMDIILTHYSKQFDIAQRIGKRLGWQIKVEGVSLEDEDNVVEVMTSFASDLGVN